MVCFVFYCVVVVVVVVVRMLERPLSHSYRPSLRERGKGEEGELGTSFLHNSLQTRVAFAREIDRNNVVHNTKY